MSTKTLKKELLAAVAMLLIATIALSGSTYAWFAQNTKVTAQTITATAQSTELLRISTENSGYSTSVELNLSTNAFIPVSAGATLAKAGTFYKVNAWQDESVTSTSDAGQLALEYTAATAGTDYAVADLWITDNNAADVYFSKATTVIAKAKVLDPATKNAGAPGTYDAPGAGEVYYDVYAQFIAGSGITTYTLAKGTVLSSDANGAISNSPAADVAATTAAKTRLENALGALRLTFVPYMTAVAEDGSTTSSSTTAGATAAAQFYTFSATTTGYYNTQNGTDGNNVAADQRIASVDGNNKATLETDSVTTLSNTVQLTSLDANAAKHYKVYCYLEGCDKQCITGIADNVTYTVSLGFAQASAL